MASVCKKTNMLLTDVDILLMNEAGIRVECVNQQIHMLKQIINT